MRDTLPLWNDLPMELRPKIRFWVPAAAMDEQDLRQELRNLCARGFGGVEVVTLESVPEVIARGKDGWGTARWDAMAAVIADESQKLGMRYDIAIGPGWPIASPTVDSVNHPAALTELTYGEVLIREAGPVEIALPQGRVVRNEGTPTLVHACAYVEADAGVLCRNSYLDLTPYLHGNAGIRLSCVLPQDARGPWKVFAFYRQPAGQKINAGQTYVIDHLSMEGAKACEEYWERQTWPASMESIFCDSLEYAVSLDWTAHFPEEFERRRGYSILPYLPFIGLTNLYPACDVPGYRLDERDISEMVNRDYLETLTDCYCEYHLEPLRRLANRHGKTLRYQVAYNKPFEAERSALYVDIPENEALGRPSLDYQKVMAGAAHLGRKERYSFECAAEFGQSYGQSYEDLFWWVKRSLMAGMNAQVLHGASYSGAYHGADSCDGKIPGTGWPGYEGFGKVVSNNWNRTLSETDARGCMDTIARLNAVFRKQARVDCAILRSSHSNDGLGSEFCLYQDGGALLRRGYSYEFVSESLLAQKTCTISGGVLDPEGVGYRCLIIPPNVPMTLGMLQKLKQFEDQGLPVLWIGAASGKSCSYAEWRKESCRVQWQQLVGAVFSCGSSLHCDSLEEVPDALMRAGILPLVMLDGSRDIITAVRLDQENRMTYYALYAFNRVIYSPAQPNPDEIAVSAIYRQGTTKGSYDRPGLTSRSRIPVRIRGTGRVYQCDPWSGKRELTGFTPDGSGYMSGEVEIEEDELLVLALESGECPGEGFGELPANGFSVAKGCGVFLESLQLESFEPDTEGEVSFLRSGYQGSGRTIALDALRPWKDLAPDLVRFSGRGIYRGYLQMAEKRPDVRYFLSLGEVSDTFTVRINGCAAEFPDQVMKRVDITDLLREGRNELEIVVTSNLYNRLFHENMESYGMPLPYRPRSYGIWETSTKKVAVLQRREIYP